VLLTSFELERQGAAAVKGVAVRHEALKGESRDWAAAHWRLGDERSIGGGLVIEMPDADAMTKLSLDIGGRGLLTKSPAR
jgi:hypothetical protein